MEKRSVRRRFVVSGRYWLEDRVVMTTMGRPRTAVIGLVHRGSVPYASHGAADASVRKTELPPAAGPTTKRWSWLANSYWYVPAANLPAVLYNNSTGTLQGVSDQTVFHITGYSRGYFWGETVTQLGSSNPSTSSMLASVTPEGRVVLTFTQTSTNSSPSITEGFGQMQRKLGQWTMENQMFTSPVQTLQIGHWAYMVQTRPGMASWNKLPSVGESVPEFLNQ